MPDGPETIFAAASMLVGKHDGSGYSELLESDQSARPRIRSQIATVDYNEDGKMDLLLGDFCSNVAPRPDMSDKPHVMDTFGCFCASEELR